MSHWCAVVTCLVLVALYDAALGALPLLHLQYSFSARLVQGASHCAVDIFSDGFPLSEIMDTQALVSPGLLRLGGQRCADGDATEAPVFLFRADTKDVSEIMKRAVQSIVRVAGKRNVATGRSFVPTLLSTEDVAPVSCGERLVHDLILARPERNVSFATHPGILHVSANRLLVVASTSAGLCYYEGEIEAPIDSILEGDRSYSTTRFNQPRRWLIGVIAALCVILIMGIAVGVFITHRSDRKSESCRFVPYESYLAIEA